MFKVGDEVETRFGVQVRIIHIYEGSAWIAFPDGSFCREELDRLSCPKPMPKFKVGDKVQNKNHDKLTVHSIIEHENEFFYTVTSKNNQISFVRENTIELRIEKLPFPRAGAWVRRHGYDDAYHRRIIRVAGELIHYTLVHEDGHDMGLDYWVLASNDQLTEVENPFEN